MNVLVKDNKSKWHKIVHNFLDSELRVLKLYEPVCTTNASLCLRRYLEDKAFPIGYTKRGDYIYIFRTDCVTVTIDEAIEGTYIKDKVIRSHSVHTPYLLYCPKNQVSKMIKEKK